MTQYVQDPDSRLDYACDWTGWLTDDDVIVTSVWEAPGLTVETPALDGALATVWLSGGAVGCDYRATNRVTTAAGRIDDRSLQIRIIER